MSNHVIEEISNAKGVYLLWCDGCGESHAIYHNCQTVSINWNFNGDFVKPTFSPSLKVTFTRNDGRGDTVCHSFIRNGEIQFLNDCTHELAGKTIQLKPVTEWPNDI